MSVNPGFGGQKFIASQLRKIEALAKRIAKEGLDVTLEVDGGVDATIARQCVDAGATALVAGTAAFRGGPDQYAANIAALKASAMSQRGGGLSRLATLPLLQRLVERGKPPAAPDRRRPRPCHRIQDARRAIAGRPLRQRRRSGRPRGPQLEQYRSRHPGRRRIARLRLAARPRCRRHPRKRRVAGRRSRRTLAAGAWREGRCGLGAGLVGRTAAVLAGLRPLPAVAARRRLSLGPAQHRGPRRPPSRGERRTKRHRACRGSPPGPGSTAACLLLSSGTARLAKAETGLSRALASAQYGRWRADQPLARRAGRTGRPPRPAPRRLRRRAPRLPAGVRGCRRRRAGRASWRHHGRWLAVGLAGRQRRQPIRARLADRRVRLPRPPAYATRAAGAIIG